MLPPSLSSADKPIYVNAKQYHAIIRRRKLRAKAVLDNKRTSRRKVGYLDSMSQYVIGYKKKIHIKLTNLMGSLSENNPSLIQM